MTTKRLHAALMKQPTPDRFSKVAYRLLIVEKVLSARAVAAALGMKYATFHARLAGRIPFRPEEISALLRAVPDMRLADALLSGTAFRAVRRNAKPLPDREAQFLRKPAEKAGRVAEAFRDLQVALADETPADWNDERVRKRIAAAQKALDALRLALP